MAPEDQPSIEQEEEYLSTDDDDILSNSSPQPRLQPRRRSDNWISDILRSRTTTAATASIVIAALAWKLYRSYLPQRRKPQQPSYRTASVVPLSLLLALMDEGRLRKALLGQSKIVFQAVQVLRHENQQQQPRWSRVDLPSNTLLQKQLFARLAQLKSVELSTLPESNYTQWLSGILAALPFVYLALVYRMLMRNNQLGDKDRHQTQFEHRQNNRTVTTFRDVAGIDPVIAEVGEIVQYLRNPERYQRIGAAAPNGVLLHGPPGTGKTLLAQAVAGEASVDCFLACNASDFVELYVGRGAARIRSVFQDVRAEALRRYRRRTGGTGWWPFGSSSSMPPSASPCSAILFIDELDALAKTRSSIGSNDEREQTLNQLLTEMDGFQKDNVVVIVMAATNRADVLDPAILRRFDRHIHVGHPDAAGREAILRVHAKRVALQGTIEWTSLAATTNGCSGADLRNVVNEAALLAVKDRSKVTQSHLEQGARKMQRMKASLRS